MSYSIDWPPGFVSRTCDPTDTCFVGPKGNEKGRSHAPAEKSVEALSKFTAGAGRYKPAEQRQSRRDA
jgi:hypothetical protein